MLDEGKKLKRFNASMSVVWWSLQKVPFLFACAPGICVCDHVDMSVPLEKTTAFLSDNRVK